MKIKAPAEDMGTVSRLAAVALIIIVIVLVTGFFAARTEGGAAFVQERLERHLGMDVTLERVRIGWPYALVMEHAAATNAAGGRFEAREIRLVPSWHGRVGVVVRRPRLRLVRGADGAWEPAYFSRLADAAAGDLTAFSRLADNLGPRMPLTVQDGDIAWTGDTVNAAMRGVDYRRTPVKLPGRRMLYNALSIRALTGAAGDRRDIELEWLASETVPYLEIESREAGGGGAS